MMTIHELKKVRKGITYTATITKKSISCSEYGNNPHGINSAASCTIEAFVQKKGSAATICHHVTQDYFGSRAYKAFLAKAEEQYRHTASKES